MNLENYLQCSTEAKKENIKGKRYKEENVTISKNQSIKYI